MFREPQIGSKGRARFSEIKDLPARCRLSEDKLRGALQLLLDKKTLRKEGDFYIEIRHGSFFTEDLGLNEDFFHVHKAFADNYKNLIDPPVRPGFVNTNFVFLHPQRAPEIIERLQSLRSWIEEVSATGTDDPLQEHLIFQLDMNLVPLFDIATAKKLSSPNKK